MIVHKNLEQGSEAWHQLRLGKITGSMIFNIMANGRGGNPSKLTETYMMQLLAERLTGIPTAFYKSKAMQWGNDTEDQARQYYEYQEGVDVKQVAFFELDDWVGYSPDGLVGDDGLLEIKCPESKTQIGRMIGAIDSRFEIPEEYYPQVQFGLLVTGREWCDFVSYDPRIKGTSKYLVTRVHRDDEYLIDMENRINRFIAKAEQYLALAVQ